MDEKFYTIYTIGSPELKKRMFWPNNPETLPICIADLKGICQAMGAAGMAANQIGHEHRACALRMNNGSLLIMVDPKVTEKSDEVARDSEACYSIPGYHVLVTRPETVTIQFKDEHGGAVTGQFSGNEARYAQHEIDHLDGVLISDIGLRMFGGSKLKRAKRRFKDHQYTVSELGELSFA